MNKKKLTFAKEDAERFRDAALAIENIDIENALYFMTLAFKLKPEARFIKKKLEEYLYVVNSPDVGFDVVHLHLGVHKTATTYLQGQLSSALSLKTNVQYLDLDRFRELRHEVGFCQLLNIYSRNRPLIISDENLIGHCNTPMTGEIYGNAKHYLESYIRDLNANRLIVYISIRNMADFIASSYCEYLKHNDFICFDSYSHKIVIENESWFNVLCPMIVSNNNVTFKIFNFDNFALNKMDLISDISFGEISVIDNSILQSRQRFSNEELNNFSGISVNKNNNDKFSPYSEDILSLSKINLKNDILKLSLLDNVIIL
ncbi:hypothetical protein MSG34_21230 [Vibrio sp. 1CM2L]|uniref:hypothetical protein n=1 Tax=Vibrio sp. 1CM2L TaxID=2929166 RepID=UPI0020BFFC29|nr:hypothetical protein [Vibrio sp. 1CM2L]MCK8078693.1 hypothetical protein [Vibrio sp. 1CM2L]